MYKRPTKINLELILGKHLPYYDKVKMIIFAQYTTWTDPILALDKTIIYISLVLVGTIMFRNRLIPHIKSPQNNLRCINCTIRPGVGHYI